MPPLVFPKSTIRFRVRYSEIDKMGTFYNSRALEWFEWGRVELLRAVGLSYADMEARGFFLPLIEAHLQYQGRASFDDLLLMTTTMAMSGKARVRFDMQIVQAPPCCAGAAEGHVHESCGAYSGPAPSDARRVASGHTIHAITDHAGKPVRPPTWFLDVVNKVQNS